LAILHRNCAFQTQFTLCCDSIIQRQIQRNLIYGVFKNFAYLAAWPEDFFEIETLAYNRIISRWTEEFGIADVVASSASARMLILEQEHDNETLPRATR
jgi:hypothetical protein